MKHIQTYIHTFVHKKVTAQRINRKQCCCAAVVAVIAAAVIVVVVAIAVAQGKATSCRRPTNTHTLTQLNSCFAIVTHSELRLYTSIYYGYYLKDMYLRFTWI